jgi:hypothetical protein
LIAEYDIEGKRAKGKIEHDNGKTIRVWYQGQVITRHKEKHRIKMDCSVMGTADFYCAELQIVPHGTKNGD